MIKFKKDKINPAPKHETVPAAFVLKDYALKYYDTFEPIINDLAQRCTGGEECRLAFPNGSITIKLR